MKLFLRDRAAVRRVGKTLMLANVVSFGLIAETAARHGMWRLAGVAACMIIVVIVFDALLCPHNPLWRWRPWRDG